MSRAGETCSASSSAGAPARLPARDCRWPRRPAMARPPRHYRAPPHARTAGLVPRGGDGRHNASALPIGALTCIPPVAELVAHNLAEAVQLPQVERPEVEEEVPVGKPGRIRVLKHGPDVSVGIRRLDRPAGPIEPAGDDLCDAGSMPVSHGRGWRALLTGGLAVGAAQCRIRRAGASFAAALPTSTRDSQAAAATAPHPAGPGGPTPAPMPLPVMPKTAHAARRVARIARGGGKLRWHGRRRLAVIDPQHGPHHKARTHPCTQTRRRQAWLRLATLRNWLHTRRVSRRLTFRRQLSWPQRGPRSRTPPRPPTTRARTGGPR